MGSDTSKQENPLLHAIEEGNNEQVKKLIHSHPKLLTRPDSTGAIPLFIAIKKGDNSLVQSLIEAKSNINHKAENDQTALHYACQDGRLEICKLLIEKKVGVNLVDSSEMTPMTYAIKGNHLEVVKLLASQGADLEINDGPGTPLVVAAKSFKPDILQFLIRAKANINQTNDSQESAFFALCGVKDSTPEQIIPLLKLLVEAKANFYQANYLDFTPLHQAVSSNQAATVDYLLTLPPSETKKVSFVNAQDSTGSTPLHTCIEYSASVSILKSLVDAKADVNMTDKEQITPLMLACTEGRTEIVRFMVAECHNLDMEKLNKEGETAWKIALRKGHKEILKLLKREEYVDEGELSHMLYLNAGGRSDVQFIRDFGTSDIGKPPPSGGHG